MGYLSGQWLTGDPSRASRYLPVAVEFEFRAPTTEWESRNAIALAADARRLDGGDITPVELTAKDVEAFTTAALEQTESRAAVAQAFGRFSGDELLDFIEEVASARRNRRA